MDVHENKDPCKVTDSGARRRRLRWFVLAGRLGTGLALLLAISYSICLFYLWHGDKAGDRFPPGVLADYVPEDSAAVLAVNFRQLLESSIGQQLKPLMERLIVRSARQMPWLELSEINPLDDIDTLLIFFPSTVGGEPVALAQGRFEPSRFQIGPGMLEEKDLDRFRVWEHHDRPAKQTTWLAAVGDMLVVSGSRSRVQAALRQASAPQPVSVGERQLRELLTKVDRQQSLWLAASVKKLGPVSGIDNFLLKMVLRPLAAHAETVYGGITCAEDMRAELYFSTGLDDGAAQLEADLKSICEAAPGAALLDPHKELLPLMRLLAAGQIHRQGKTVRMQCRLSADQLTK